MTTAQIVDKPWGWEKILTESDLPYACKIAFTHIDKRWSLQYHDKKIETITLLSGKAQLLVGPTKDTLETIDMIPNTGYTIKPNTIHRFMALTDCVTIEASTGEIGTTFRLEDDVNRGDETEEIRNLPNRGWTSQK